MLDPLLHSLISESVTHRHTSTPAHHRTTLVLSLGRGMKVSGRQIKKTGRMPPVATSLFGPVLNSDNANVSNKRKHCVFRERAISQCADQHFLPYVSTTPAVNTDINHLDTRPDRTRRPHGIFAFLRSQPIMTLASDCTRPRLGARGRARDPPPRPGDCSAVAMCTLGRR